jgi:hypothetical protein
MSINITALESALQSKLNAATGSTESKEFLLLTKALESLNSGAVSEVATTGDLPTASDNTGRTLYVTAESSIYFSNGTTWASLDPQTVIDGAPAALDTLNELAAALNDDANFATTVTDSIATKLPLAGGTMTGNIDFADGVAARFGASQDLSISHDGTNSYINELGTGDLVIQTNGDKIGLASSDPFEWMVEAVTNGAVTLSHDGSAKLATTATGIGVTGNATFGDNGKAIFGAGSDLQIYHDGNNSVIADNGTGNLLVYASTDLILQQSGSANRYADFAENGAGRIYHSGNVKFTTTAIGADVTGEFIADSYNETYAAVTSSSNATTVNCEAGNTFSHTLTENTTFTFSNPPATGTSYSMSVEIIQDAGASGFTVTWPTSVDFPAATAPTLTATASAVDVFVFTTRDGGTTWYGFTAGQALA